MALPYHDVLATKTTPPRNPTTAPSSPVTCLLPPPLTPFPEKAGIMPESYTRSSIPPTPPPHPLSPPSKDGTEAASERKGSQGEPSACSWP